MAVHILGGSTEMEELRNIVKRKKIILIEDTCESLGSKYSNKYLGTFGDFGTYSFITLIKLRLERVEWLYVIIMRIIVFYIL